jgi:hypothetical protein
MAVRDPQGSPAVTSFYSITYMYLLYVDESGDTGLAGGSKHLLLAGVALFEGKWRWLKDELEFLLTRYFPNAAERPVEIHTADVRKGRVQYSKLTQAQRLQFLADTCAIIHRLNERELTFFTVVYDKKWWWQRHPGATGDDLYQSAFEDLVSRFDYYLTRRLAEGEPSKGIIIADPRSAAFSSALRKSVIRFHSVGTRWAKLRHVTESVLFLGSHESPGLQLADFCSYSVWRLVEAADDSLARRLTHCFDREPIKSVIKPGHWHGVRYYGDDTAVQARIRKLWPPTM